MAKNPVANAYRENSQDEGSRLLDPKTLGGPGRRQEASATFGPHRDGPAVAT